MRLIVVVVLFLPTLVFCQPRKSVYSVEHYLDLFSDSDQRSSNHGTEFLDFIRKAESKKNNFRDDKAFLYHLFVKTHTKFLRTFEPGATFGDSFASGRYNCLTGTALYALLLDHFGFEYTITETNYHIFLTAETTTGQVLIEITDPVRGFVTDASAIQKKLEGYRQNEVAESENGKFHYRYSFDLFNEVDLEQLSGLLYYNLAIASYNNHQFDKTIKNLEKAFEFYNSPRIEEFSRVILLTVSESSLDASTKELYIRKIQTIRKKRHVMMASASE